MILQVSYRWSRYHPWDVCKQPCKEWNISTANRKTGEFTILAIQQYFFWSPIKRGLVFMGPIMLDDPPEGFHPPKQKNPEVQIARRSYFGPFFFFVANFWGTKKPMQQKVVVFVFCLLFFWWKLNAWLSFDHWSFNHLCPPYFFCFDSNLRNILPYQTRLSSHFFGVTWPFPRPIILADLFGLSTLTTLGPPNFGSEEVPGQSGNPRRFLQGDGRWNIIPGMARFHDRGHTFPPKFKSSRTWEMMAKEDDPFASFWGKRPILRGELLNFQGVFKTNTTSWIDFGKNIFGRIC